MNIQSSSKSIAISSDAKCAFCGLDNPTEIMDFEFGAGDLDLSAANITKTETYKGIKCCTNCRRKVRATNLLGGVFIVILPFVCLLLYINYDMVNPDNLICSAGAPILIGLIGGFFIYYFYSRNIMKLLYERKIDNWIGDNRVYGFPVQEMPKISDTQARSSSSVDNQLQEPDKKMAKSKAKKSASTRSHNPQRCPRCKASTHFEIEGNEKWLVCDKCGWSRHAER